MISITKKFRFEAAHQLQDWPEYHKCHNLHGHSYQVEITVTGPVPGDKSKPGAILDFYDMKVCADNSFMCWDHHNLNELLKERNTTAEFLVFRIADEYMQWLRNAGHSLLGVQLTKVRVYETQDGYAEWSIDK